MVIYHVTEETYFGSPKAALVRVHHQSVLVKSPENLVQVSQVLFFVLAGDENVGNVGTAEVETAQDAIDE